MKVIFNTTVVLQKVRGSYRHEWMELLKRNGIEWMLSRDSDTPGDDTYRFDLNPDKKHVTVNLADEDMKVFLNTIEAHTSRPIKYIYLGNMRFDMQFD